ASLLSIRRSFLLRTLLFPLVFLVSSCGDHRDLHSFPTRRSSDLRARGRACLAALGSARPLSNGSGFSQTDAKRRQGRPAAAPYRSEEHTSELQSRENLVCRLLLEKKNKRETA